MTIARVHLFTTTDAGSGRRDTLARLVASLAKARAARPDVPLTLHLLAQRAAPGALGALPNWVDVSAIDGRVSLSRARNVMLAAAPAEAFAADTLVAFPDDDAWYPPGLLAGVTRLMDGLMERGGADFVFCRYAARPYEFGAGDARPARLAEVITAASSNTLFLTGALVRAVGGFDEELGVGARVNGGEDTDYALRAHARARLTLIDPRPLVGHRDPDPTLRGRYYAGSLRAIARHARAHPAGAVPLARKLAVGAYYVLRGRLSPLGYLNALAGLGGGAPSPVSES